jgi:hypothetical protein
MRLHLILFFLLPAASATASQIIELWPLVDASAIYPAPKEIQDTLVKLEKESLASCQQDSGLPATQNGQFFSAKKISLGSGPGKYYLVFPSAPCTEYFGAHSVQFWLVAMGAGRTVKVLLSARQDGLRILSRRHRGMFDIQLRYNGEVQTLAFDGVKYGVARGRTSLPHEVEHIL